jgi:hypothetical protein
MKVINIPVDNAENMVLRHQFLLKEALAAAAYHQEQIDLLSKAIKDVTYMVTEQTSSISGSDAGSTSEPASSAPTAVDLKDDAMPELIQGNGIGFDAKKADLVNILKEHEAEFGTFDIDVETIASFLMAK